VPVLPPLFSPVLGCSPPSRVPLYIFVCASALAAQASHSAATIASVLSVILCFVFISFVLLGSSLCFVVAPSALWLSVQPWFSGSGSGLCLRSLDSQRDIFLF
jgi:hypothetical protein